MGKRILAAIIAAACLLVPTTAFAATNSNASETPLANTSASSLSAMGTTPFSVTYPYADANNDGQNDFILEVAKPTSAYYKYTYETPQSVSAPVDGAVTAVFSLSSTDERFYRVTNPLDDDAVTFGDYVDLLSTTNVTVTRADMRANDAGAFDSGTVVCDFSRNKYDTGDLYLNVGSSGHVQLQVGGAFSLCPLRNWLPMGGHMVRQVLQPDFHVEVIDLDGTNAVSAVENTTTSSARHTWTITGNHAGTAIVKVTYDALVHAGAMEGLTDFSAVWPENTGLFVVTVGKASEVRADFKLNADRNNALRQTKPENSTDYYGAEAKQAGDALDAEFDVLYYAGSDGARLTFATEVGAQVSVARGSVESGVLQIGAFSQDGVSVAADGTATVSGLTTGKHIVKVEKNGNVAYQVVRARAINYKVYAGTDTTVAAKLVCDSATGVVNAYTNGTTSITRAAYEALSASGQAAYEPLVSPGGTVTVVFDRLAHPANKAFGYYNMTAALSLKGSDGAEYTATVSPFGDPGQYTFESSLSCQKLAVRLVDTVADGSYTLTGSIKVGGFGYGGYGAHRALTYAQGRSNSGNAPSYTAYFGELPLVSLDVVVSQEATEAEKARQAQEAADDFAALVQAIGTVNAGAEPRITKARMAYNALSAEARARVDASALAKLEQAEAQLATLLRANYNPANIADGYVRVIVENSTWSMAAGAPWEGVLLDEQVKLNVETDTMRTLVDRACEQAGKAAPVGNKSYVKEIEGLGDPEAAASAGESSGWMVTLNDWFINAGMNAFAANTLAVRSGDEIRLVYTCDGGPDVGSSATANTKELKGLAVNAGALSPAFSASVHDYTLTVAKGTSAVYVKPNAKNRNFQARAYIGTPDPYESGYRANDAIPVKDGTVITVLVGDKSWPSMNASILNPETYRITVRYQSDSGSADDEAAKKAAQEKAAADKKAASAVTNAIAKLPATADVTDANAKAVTSARTAYNKLTADQKKLVPAASLKKLKAAETAVKTTITLNTAKVTKASVSKALKKAGKKAASIKKIVLGAKVKSVGNASFSTLSKAQTLVLKTKKLKETSVGNCLKSSKVKTTKVQVGSAKANKSYAKKYKKFFVKKVVGKKVTVA